MDIEERKNYYQDCVFYPFGLELKFAFRYETELFGGKICVPSSEALQDEGLAQFKKI